jgi:hypothetical protein
MLVDTEEGCKRKKGPILEKSGTGNTPKSMPEDIEIGVLEKKNGYCEGILRAKIWNRPR